MTPAALLAQAEALETEAAALRERAEEMAAQERATAVVEALDQYSGSPSGRAKVLSTDLRSYAGNGWSRERSLVTLSADAPPKRRAWHRLLRSRNGETIGWRQILNISEVCNEQPLPLQTFSSESDFENGEADSNGRV
jgi:hypothetical protein